MRSDVGTGAMRNEMEAGAMRSDVGTGAMRNEMEAGAMRSDVGTGAMRNEMEAGSMRSDVGTGAMRNEMEAGSSDPAFTCNEVQNLFPRMHLRTPVRVLARRLYQPSSDRVFNHVANHAGQVAVATQMPIEEAVLPQASAANASECKSGTLLRESDKTLKIAIR